MYFTKCPAHLFFNITEVVCLLQVISVCQGGCLIIWMVDSGQKVKTFNNAHGNAEVTSLAQDPSETRIFTGGSDGTIKVCIH